MDQINQNYPQNPLQYEQENSDKIWYLNQNIEVFEHITDYANQKSVKIWTMVWHMFVPDYYETNFTNILAKSDYILTDDMSMQGYRSAEEKDGYLFTTQRLLSNEQLNKKTITINRN